jgi:alpha-tubulin suppressor-like RCC1 family protein
LQTSTGPFGAIAAGANHSLALRTDGLLFATGLNTSGQLGNGSTTNSVRFTQVSNVSMIAIIGAGDNHSLAAVAQ